MKKIFPLLLVTLLLFALSLPVSLLAQQNQTPGSGSSSGSGSSGLLGSPPPTRRAAGRDRSRSDATVTIEQDFAEALTIVEDNYVDGSRLDYNTVTKSSIIGMLRSLDPHSNYYDRTEFEELRTDQRSEYFGIGAAINNWRIGNGDQVETYIMATFEGAPAARAGLRYGDRIISVDGQPMTGKPSSDVRDRIRGPRGTTVKIQLERAATGRTETVEITRDAVGQPSIPDYYMLRPGVGYVDVRRGFNYTTADELERALEGLRAKGMTSLVLDLRDNPGGFLDQAVRVTGKFLQRDQVILTQRGRRSGGCSPGAERGRDGECIYKARNTTTDATPILVMINRGSASASEIVAGALQDHDRALIVGENSFGKGLVQSIIPLEYGAGLTLTSAKYYTPSGRLIQRDYSNGGLYDYYFRRQEEEGKEAQQPARPPGTESRTDSGRVVYGGGGITPDETVKPRVATPAQGRLLDSIFGFTRELVNNRIPGFDSYKVQRAIEFNHALQAADFPITDALYAAYKKYVLSKPAYKITAAQIDRNRDFAQRRLRFDIITAAYGSVTADRVNLADDPQTAKAVEAVPRARDLAATAARARSAQQKSFE